AAIRRAKAQAARLGPVDAPLLITGETGTGKELFARACHQVSARARRPFLALNCAALPEGLAESELFGYAPGAFTSARRGGKPGLLELADTGTVFLDEVGELTPYLQAKLLRFLADGSFRRVGAAAESRVDVRVISATNRDLEAMSREGAFREDLFFRLNVLALDLPALRERPEDIAGLADFFLARAARQVGRPPPALSAAARSLLQGHAWPGNVRELENVIFRAVTLAEGDRIGAEDLDLAAARSSPSTTAVSPLPADPRHYASYAAARDAFEEAFFRALYPDFPSTRKLARRLGLSHAAIADRLRRYGIG
ncbi:MAG: sigma 54-interacting transcriptional regulator, partial [Azospirillaceae bacterium]